MKSVHKIEVVCSLAAVVGIILPLQTYFGNASIFPFSFGRLLPELLGLFIIFTMGLGLLVWLLERLSPIVRLPLSPYLFAFFVAVLACVYLESGILSAGLPELNGGPVAELANQPRGCIDVGVWMLLVIAFLVFARRLVPFVHWMARVILVLSLAALADVIVGAAGGGQQIGELPCSPSTSNTHLVPLAFQSQPTVVANVKYSPTRNILVFILDSMPGKAAIDVLAANAALCAKFPGFTAYPNNIGMHECTKRGVPGLVTGRYYDPAEISEAAYPMTMYATNSFVRAAEAAGWNVAFSPDLLPYGATNLPVEKRVARVEKRRSRDHFAFLRQTTEVPYLSLFDTVAFRLSPFFFKGPILYSRIRHAVKGRHSAEGFWGERTMYPELAARPVSEDTRAFLGVFHSWGVHPPWSADFATTVTDKLRLLAGLLDAYRASGLYDKSLIIVTADHGLDGVPPLEGYPSSASAFLMVKPEGENAPFHLSAARTSHARMAPLVRAAIERPLSREICDGILKSDTALYRAEVRDGGHEYFKDWSR